MRHILHADFDAFYTSIEQLDNPALRGMPVVVGGSPEGRGVVASASYEARRFSVRSAVPMRTALQRCPQAIRVQPRFDRYQQVSRQVMAIFKEITTLVEPLSLDEAFLDVTGGVTPDRPPGKFAADLRLRVKSELGLTIVPPGSERRFLAPLGVEKLWGIGPKTAARLADDGVHTVADLVSRPGEWWHSRFGRMGPDLRRLALGEDDRAVVVHRDRKSVSAETTLAQDTGDPELLFELIDQLSQRVARHLSSVELRGRTVRVKLRLADFTIFTRQTTRAEPASSPDAIAGAARTLLQRELRPDRLFRLVGVGVSGFERAQGLPLQPRLTGFES